MIYQGKGLHPLFHSEITSSYMLYDIFKCHPQIITALIKNFFKLAPKVIEIIEVFRERPCAQEGVIDLFVPFISQGKQCSLIIEIKVHDYQSATNGQISTYYNAVCNEKVYARNDIYFIYLTQFTKRTNFGGVLEPKTIAEAEIGKVLIGDHFIHLSWIDIHKFMTYYHYLLSDEQQLIAHLHKQWIVYKCKTDLVSHRMTIGGRDLKYYFPDISIDIQNRLPFGISRSANNKSIWEINLSGLDDVQLEDTLMVIKAFTQSAFVDRTNTDETKESTLDAAKNFLKDMSRNVEDWHLLPFYSKLFTFAENTRYVKFNGKGTNGFSIILKTTSRDDISLCTLYRNKRLLFALKR